MPALSFQIQFCPHVEDGSKGHSIRDMRERPFKVGDACHLYYAMRNAKCRLLGRAWCTKVQPIRIDRARVWIDGDELDLSEKDALAWADGFRWHFGDDCAECRDTKGCFDMMLAFWAKEHGDKVFNGHIIFWDWENRCKCTDTQTCLLCEEPKKVHSKGRRS